MKISVKKVGLIFMLITLAFAVNAQDKNMQAIVYYNKAEIAFNNAAYEDALNYISQSELLLNSTNSKLLYLKIEILDMMAKIDAYKVHELRRNIAQFFQDVDQNTYPKDKYMKITTILVDLNERIKSEDDDYKKIKNFTDISELELYLNKHPASKYDSEIRPQYNKLKEKQKELLNQNNK
jgi:hypothetical protein